MFTGRMKPRFWTPHRHRLAVTVLITAAILASLANTVTWAHRVTSKQNPADAVLERVERVKPYLEGIDRVGYWSDSELRHEFVLTQYALIPVIVNRYGIERHVVGVFDDPERALAEYPSQGLSLIQDLGNGVMLFERKDAQGR